MLPHTKKLINELKKKDLPIEDKSALTAVLMDKINALPLDNVLVLVPGVIQVNGRILDKEQIINLKESCVVLNDNQARKIIHEQLRYLAIVEGVHRGLSTEQLIFSKAALWIIEQENLLIEKIVSQSISNASNIGFSA